MDELQILKYEKKQSPSTSINGRVCRDGASVQELPVGQLLPWCAVQVLAPRPGADAVQNGGMPGLPRGQVSKNSVLPRADRAPGAALRPLLRLWSPATPPSHSSRALPHPLSHLQPKVHARQSLPLLARRRRSRARPALAAGVPRFPAWSLRPRTGMPLFARGTRLLAGTHLLARSAAG